METMNAKLNPGSDWWMEIGHNGNGNIEVRASLSLFRSGQWLIHVLAI
jgi:hypothetical protein